MTAVEALLTCTAYDAQLPVPLTIDDSHFLASIGNSYLGIRGGFDNEVINWTNIYTEVYPN